MFKIINLWWDFCSVVSTHSYQRKCHTPEIVVLYLTFCLIFRKNLWDKTCKQAGNCHVRYLLSANLVPYRQLLQVQNRSIPPIIVSFLEGCCLLQQGEYMNAQITVFRMKYDSFSIDFTSQIFILPYWIRCFFKVQVSSMRFFIIWKLPWDILIPTVADHRSPGG